MRKLNKALLAGVACVPLLTASTCSQGIADINALLGSSAASTMIAYLASLDPKVAGILTNVDAAIAKDAPGVLRIICGAGSAADYVFRTASTLDAKLFTSAMVSNEALAFTELGKSCAPNPPPASVADLVSAYEQILADLTASGVVVAPKTTAMLRR